MNDKKPSKTLGQKQQILSRQKTFFGVLLTFLAATSFTFGMQYLDRLWYMMLGQIQFIPGDYQQIIFSMLGGLSAVMMTTWAYTQWKAIKLNDTTTADQFDYALYGEYMSFTIDTLYSILSLITLIMVDRINPNLMNRLEWASVLLFVSVCVGHGVLMHLYKSADADVTRVRIESKITGEMTTEKLLFMELVTGEGLTIASNDAQSTIDDFVKVYAKAVKQELMAQFQLPSELIIEENEPTGKA